MYKKIQMSALACRPVARFQDLVGHNTFLSGQDFCFHYMFKTNFLGATKFCGAQKKFGGHCSRMPPRGYGPSCVESSIGAGTILIK